MIGSIYFIVGDHTALEDVRACCLVMLIQGMMTSTNITSFMEQKARIGLAALSVSEVEKPIAGRWYDLLHT